MADIGATLREARMRARVDITQVESATKIRAKYLRAIEDEEWGVLPGPAYTKSFLREYADFLGLDSRMLVEEYKRRYEPPPELEPLPLGSGRVRDRPREPGRWRRWVPVAIVIVAILGALAALSQLGGGNENQATTTTARTTGARHARRPKPRPVATFVRLQLVPTGPVYVCLENGAGQKLVNGVILQAGQPTRTFRARRMLLTLGNASVRLRIDGRTVAVPPSPTAIGLELTAHGRRPLPPAKRPNCA